MSRIFNWPEQTGTRRLLRQQASTAEQLLWQALRGQQLGVKFRRQQGIGPYIVDLYCAEWRLVIELDRKHPGSAAEQQAELQHDSYMQQLGLQVLRITDQDVIEDLSGVLARIRHWLSPP